MNAYAMSSWLIVRHVVVNLAYIAAFTGRRKSPIVAVRQFRDRDSASSTAKKAGAEADQTSTELLDKANAYVDDLKVAP